MEKLRINKKLSTLALLSISSVLAMTGCGKKNTIASKNIDAATIENTSEITTGDISVTESVKVNNTDLNMQDNNSIENVVSTSYNENMEFYNKYGISEDQVRDIVLVLNDKYQDEEGNLIIDSERVSDAYDNIEKILSQSDDPFIQKTDNISTINYGKEHPEDEAMVSIAKEVEASNDWEVLKHPSLVPFIDKSISGSTAVIEKISEWEKERDYQIECMNNSNSYDVESINDYIRNQEVTKYNNNTDNMNTINGRGQKFAIVTANAASKQFAGSCNQNVIYIEGYSAIEQNIKINPTDEERFLENQVKTLLYEGLLDEETYNLVLGDTKSRLNSGYAVNEIEEELHKKYTIDNSTLRLLVSYANYLTTMSIQKDLDVQCSVYSETIELIEKETNKKTSSIKPKILELV